MKIFVLATLMSFFAATSMAQTTTVKGIVKDSTKAVVMEGATVVLYNLLDSSVVQTTMTNSKGFFEMTKIPIGGYRLYISSVQFSSIIKDFVADGKTSIIDLQTIWVFAGKRLEDVTVVANNPIRVAQDTVEFKADAFKTRPNAMVEDLLKKLPGVEVDKQGNIKAGGQQVTRVLVDGKPFFGNDPKTATKNLPANIIDKVQVIDKKSDQAQFTGFDDGTTERVINITIKKDKKKGFFGRANGGIGTNDRYESNLSFNRFNNGKQLSIIGQANNINQEGFSFQDIMDFNGSGGFGGGRSSDGGGMSGGGGGGMSVMMTRGGGGMFGGQSFGGMPSGLADTKAIGTNFSNSWGKKLTISGSYFYNQSNRLTESESERQTFALDTNLNNFNKQKTISNSKRGNHRFNFDMDWNIDSMSSILIRPNITVVENDNESNTTNNIASKILNRNVVQTSNSINNQTSLSGTALWRHKTRKKGRTLSLRLNAGTSNNNNDGENVNTQNVIGIGGPVTLVDDQKFTSERIANTYNLRTTYTEPLTKTRILELYHVLGGNINSTDRNTVKNNGLGQYIFDSTQSNNFENSFRSQQLGFNIQTKMKKYDYTLGVGIQEADLISNNLLTSTSITQKNVINLFPNARVNYNFGKNRRLSVNYRGNTNQPSATQLQPVIDKSNQLIWRQGNPDLRQEFSNNASIMYNNFNFISGKTFLTFINFGNTANKIVDSVRNIGPGLQFRKPTNVNGAFNVIGNVAVGFPIKFIKTTNINFNSMVFYNNDVNFTDAVKNFTKMTTLTQSVNINHNYKDKLDVMLSGSVNYTSTKYTFKNATNTKYYNYTFSGDVSYMFKNGLTIQSDVEQYIYTGRGEGFNQQYTLWAASMSKTLLKDKSLELKLTAYDLLKQNRAITRTVQETYIEDSRNNVLGQYFMVSLKYNLSKFGGKGAKTFSMPKIPGMRQMNNMRIGL